MAQVIKLIKKYITIKKTERIITDLSYLEGTVSFSFLN